MCCGTLQVWHLFQVEERGGGFGSRSCILHLIGGDCICKLWTTRQEIDYAEYWDSFFFLVRRCLNSFFHAVFNRSSGKFQSVWRPQKSRNNIFPSDFEYLFFVFFLWLYHRTTFFSSECPPSCIFVLRLLATLFILFPPLRTQLIHNPEQPVFK